MLKLVSSDSQIVTFVMTYSHSIINSKSTLHEKYKKIPLLGKSPRLEHLKLET